MPYIDRQGRPEIVADSTLKSGSVPWPGTGPEAGRQPEAEPGDSGAMPAGPGAGPGPDPEPRAGRRQRSRAGSTVTCA
jgi:hypothetical protein